MPKLQCCSRLPAANTAGWLQISGAVTVLVLAMSVRFCRFFHVRRRFQFGFGSVTVCYTVDYQLTAASLDVSTVYISHTMQHRREQAVNDMETQA